MPTQEGVLSAHFIIKLETYFTQFDMTKGNKLPAEMVSDATQNTMSINLISIQGRTGVDEEPCSQKLLLAYAGL